MDSTNAGQKIAEKSKEMLNYEKKMHHGLLRQC